MNEADILGPTHQQFMDAVRPLENPTLWGVVLSHRTRCLRIMRARIVQLLDDPTMNRRRLRAEIDAIVNDLETHGC
jgi:hypothetical protein